MKIKKILDRPGFYLVSQPGLDPKAGKTHFRNTQFSQHKKTTFVIKKNAVFYKLFLTKKIGLEPAFMYAKAEPWAGPSFKNSRKI